MLSILKHSPYNHSPLEGESAKRGQSPKLSRWGVRTFFKSGTLSLCAAALLSSGLVFHAPPTEAGQERRPPPQARRAASISETVRRGLQRVQGMMFPEEEGEEPDVTGAKRELDRLYEERYDRLNTTELANILTLYASYYVTIEDYRSVRQTFQEMLDIEGLREDFRLRALRSLGQLAAMDENWQRSINYYNQWQDLSESEDALIYRGLGMAYYQLEDFDRAFEYWIDYMVLSIEAGRQPSRGDYNTLRGMFYTKDDMQSTLDIIETMVVLFDDGDDWKTLSSGYGLFDSEELDDRRIGSLDIANTRNYFDEDDENYYVNLGQSLGGRGMPYSGAKVMQKGLEAEAVEATVDNLSKLAEMYTLANMYGDAIGPARQAADMDETGNSADTLGYLQYVNGDNEDAVASFQEALEKGELENPSDTMLYMARALASMKDYETAMDAAVDSMNAALDEDRDNAVIAARNYMTYISNRAERDRVLAERKEAVIEYYQGYPPIIMD